MQQFIIGISFVLLFTNSANAQVPDYPTAGDPCPDFTLTNVRNYSTSTLSNKDFVGKKWLIIDFWARTCRTCIQSFPKINEWQEEFRDEVEFVLVGNNSTEYNKGIEDLYERQRTKYNLDLTVAFDSTLREKFYFRVIPHLVIVDKQGIIYATIGSNDLSREKLQDLVDGKMPTFKLKTE